MLTIDDFQKQSAQEYGEDGLDAIESEYSVYLVPKQPVEDLPELRVRIWHRASVANGHEKWTWNWRTAFPGPEVASPQGGPIFQIRYVGGRTEHDTLCDTIAEAADAAIASINDYLENELPTERRMEEQRALAELDRNQRIRGQVNDFLDT